MSVEVGLVRRHSLVRKTKRIMSTPILEVRHLCIEFPSKTELIRAVKNVSFTLAPGETLGIVGESGSGKSVTSLAVMGLLPSTAQVTGEILFCHPHTPNANSVNLLMLSANKRRTYRGGLISMVFQEPLTSLNPVFTCGEQVVEAILLHQEVSHQQAKRTAIALFDEVGLPDPKRMMNRYPHQLSGCQQTAGDDCNGIEWQPSNSDCR